MGDWALKRTLGGPVTPLVMPMALSQALSWQHRWVTEKRIFADAHPYSRNVEPVWIRRSAAKPAGRHTVNNQIKIVEFSRSFHGC